jgi:hypothetical protein
VEGMEKLAWWCSACCTAVPFILPAACGGTSGSILTVLEGSYNTGKR